MLWGSVTYASGAAGASEAEGASAASSATGAGGATAGALSTITPLSIVVLQFEQGAELITIPPQGLPHGEAVAHGLPQGEAVSQPPHGVPQPPHGAGAGAQQGLGAGSQQGAGAGVQQGAGAGSQQGVASQHGSGSPQHFLAASLAFKFANRPPLQRERGSRPPQRDPSLENNPPPQALDPPHLRPKPA